MRKLFLLSLAILLSCSLAHATLAFDAHSASQTSPYTHTPAGTPAAVIQYVHQFADLTDNGYTCTYGGVSIPLVTFAVKDGTEDVAIYSYALFSGIPTGAQSVACTGGGHFITYTATGTGTLRLAGTSGYCVIQVESSTDESCSITGIAGASLGFIGMTSGCNSTGFTGPITGWTEGDDTDRGAWIAWSAYMTAEQASGNITAGFTTNCGIQARVAIGIGIEEVPVVSGRPARKPVQID